MIHNTVNIKFYQKFISDNSKEEFVVWFLEIMQQKHGISKEKIINFLGKQLGPWIKQCLSWGLCYNMAISILKPFDITDK